MKKITFIISFIFVTTVSFSQYYVIKDTYGKAILSENNCVTIDASQALEQYYVIDITSFNYVDVDFARKIFGNLSNNLLTYKVDFEDQVVYLEIHSNGTREVQSSTWWKEYILSLCK